MSGEIDVDDQDFNPIKWASIGAAAVVVVLVMVWGGLTHFVYPNPEKPQAVEPVAARGQFGDMFGLANALFSGLAFTGLLVSLAMQRRELSLQRKELAMQRDEVRKAREEAAKQSIALVEQSATMARQAEIGLMAARIQGTGALLSTAFAATSGNNAAQVYLTQNGISPYGESVKHYKDLSAQLKAAHELIPSQEQAAPSCKRD